MTDDPKGVLRSIAWLLSNNAVADSNGNANTREDVFQNIAENLKKQHGITIEIPSMSASASSTTTTTTTKTSNNNQHAVTNNAKTHTKQKSMPISNVILQHLIRKGNPFPPKTSYAKGKKKLQKRRRSSKINLSPTLRSLLHELDDNDDEMIQNMSAPLIYLYEPKEGSAKKENMEDIEDANDAKEANCTEEKKDVKDEEDKGNTGDNHIKSTSKSKSTETKTLIKNNIMHGKFLYIDWIYVYLRTY